MVVTCVCEMVNISEPVSDCVFDKVADVVPESEFDEEIESVPEAESVAESELDRVAKYDVVSKATVAS